MRSLPSWLSGLAVDESSEVPRLVAAHPSPVSRSRGSLVAAMSPHELIHCDLADIGEGVSFGKRQRLLRLVQSLAAEAGSRLVLVADPSPRLIRGAVEDARNADLVAQASSRFGLDVRPVSESPYGDFTRSHSRRRLLAGRLRVFLRYRYVWAQMGGPWERICDELVLSALAHELVHWFPSPVDPALGDWFVGVDDSDPRSVFMEAEVDRQVVALGHVVERELHLEAARVDTASLRSGTPPPPWRETLVKFANLPPDAATQLLELASEVAGSSPPSVVCRLAERDPDSPWTAVEVSEFAAEVEALSAEPSVSDALR